MDPADVHIGKLSMGLGDDYNNEIAIHRAKEGVKGLLDKSSGFNIDKILFVAGNDILHTDNPKRTTTAGTPQDTDGMWYSNFDLALELYVHVIDLLTKVADVHVVFNPSNHDYTNGFFLAKALNAWYRNSKNVTFDIDMKHRKYFTYFNNLIGTTHGDGAKEAHLPGLMAHEASKVWGQCEKRYWFTHHVHHKTAKDI